VRAKKLGRAKVNRDSTKLGHESGTILENFETLLALAPLLHVNWIADIRQRWSFCPSLNQTVHAKYSILHCHTGNMLLHFPVPPACYRPKQ
jgi:hypothetical protein